MERRRGLQVLASALVLAGVGAAPAAAQSPVDGLLGGEAPPVPVVDELVGTIEDVLEPVDEAVTGAVDDVTATVDGLTGAVDELVGVEEPDAPAAPVSAPVTSTAGVPSGPPVPTSPRVATVPDIGVPDADAVAPRPVVGAIARDAPPDLRRTLAAGASDFRVPAALAGVLVIGLAIESRRRPDRQLASAELDDAPRRFT